MKRITMPSPAMVVACAALALSLGGTGYAVSALPKGSVGSGQLRANAVVSAKVKDGTLRAIDFAPGQLPAGPQGASGPAGPAGAVGPQGAAGKAGAPGISGYEVVRTYGYPASLEASTVLVEAPCTAGKKAIGGGGYVVASQAKVAATGSYPSYVANSTTGMWRFYAREIVPNTNEYWHAEASVICAYVD